MGGTLDKLQFGDYQILDQIGKGGMGVVFKAHKGNENEVVALKVLPNALSKNETAIRRFTRESELAKKLVHPNIVRSIEFGEVESRHFLAMEFVDGKNLSQLVEEGGTALLTAVEYLRDATRGVNYAHSQNVIHRDIKPSNMLVHKNGTVKILDMGLARNTMLDGIENEVGATELTMTGTLLGTTGYMAPEQALNSKNADHRSDIYSLGCTFHFLLTGREIYAGSTFVEKIVAHREQPIPVLNDERDDVPPALQSIFNKMVAKDVEQRYQSTDELLSAIECCYKKFGHGWMLTRFVKEKRRKN